MGKGLESVGGCIFLGTVGFLLYASIVDSCKKESKPVSAIEQKVSEEPSSKYSFNDFGVLKEGKACLSRYTHIIYEDVDNDGDLDLTTVSEHGKITIYENKMSKKSRVINSEDFPPTNFPPVRNKE